MDFKGLHYTELFILMWILDLGSMSTSKYTLNYSNQINTSSIKFILNNNVSVIQQQQQQQQQLLLLLHVQKTTITTKAITTTITTTTNNNNNNNTRNNNNNLRVVGWEYRPPSFGA